MQELFEIHLIENLNMKFQEFQSLGAGTSDFVNLNQKLTQLLTSLATSKYNIISRDLLILHIDEVYIVQAGIID